MNKNKAEMIFFAVIIIFLIIALVVNTNEAEKQGYTTGYENGYAQALEDYGIDNL